MSRTALVYCNCYRDGKTSPLPVTLDGLVYIDEFKSVELAGDYALDLENKFDKWKESACPHEGGAVYLEHLRGIQILYNFAKELGGAGKYPLLASDFCPLCDNSFLSPSSAEKLLLELDCIELERFESDLKVLRDEENKIVDYVAKGQANKICSYSGEIDFRLSYDDGFLIEKKNLKENARVIFRSKCFFQEKLGPYTHRYTDVVSSVAVETQGANSLDWENVKTKVEYRLVEETWSLRDWVGWQIDTLRNLANASLETGNPIVFV